MTFNWQDPALRGDRKPNRRTLIAPSTLIVPAAILALTLASRPAAAAPGETASTPSSYGRPELLVETAWLEEHIVDGDLAIVDLRPSEQYMQAHIPGSFNLDDDRLVKRDGEPPYVPDPAEFKAVMESIGVSSTSHVIAVDDVGGKSAARLWWALGYFGHDRVSVLNGGFNKWEGEGRAVTVDPPFGKTAIFEPKPRPARAASADQVRDWKKHHPGGGILDARTAPEYTGERQRSRRGGHIPGAVSVPWETNLAEKDGFLVFKPAADLAGIYARAGVGKETEVVSYCQEGRRATHLLFTLALLGYSSEGANYVGSWGEWGNRDDLPVEGGKSKTTPASPARKPVPPEGSKAPGPAPVDPQPGKAPAPKPKP